MIYQNKVENVVPEEGKEFYFTAFKKGDKWFDEPIQEFAKDFDVRYYEDTLESGDVRKMVQSRKPNEITNLISALINHEG